MLGLSIFLSKSFVNKESMCNFAAQFDREIFKPLTFKKQKNDCSTCKKKAKNIEKKR